MKKGMNLLFGVLLLMILTVLGGCGGEKEKLKVYMPSEYMDESLEGKFERAFDCDVIIEKFDSNESMYTKLQSGEKYDILIPSDYMISRLLRENYLQTVDWDKIPNASGLNPDVMGREFDPDNEYSVPYFWGSVGIIYDTTVVDAADAAEGWDLLTNTKYTDMIYMYDSERDSFMVALKALGYSMNTDNKDELDEAYKWLVNQCETTASVIVGDEVIDNMISGNKAIAVVYSGDAVYAMSENEDLAYMEPKQGTNLWYDCMVITKACENTDLAHSFINFMLDEENARANTEEVGYTSPVKSVYEEMLNGDYADISAYQPRTNNANDECFLYQTTEIKSYCADLWTRVKAVAK